MPTLLLLAVSMFFPSATTEGHQARRDVIRGQVTSDGARGVRGADVLVTMAPSAETFMATTDSLGRYRVAIAEGTGEYLLYISAPGRRAFRRRVTLAGRDSVAVIDAQLPNGIAQLDAIRVLASRPRPNAYVLNEPSTGVGQVTDKVADGVVGLVTPDQEGSIEALAATVPGVTVTPGGISAFGTEASQTLTTLNGLAFAGGSLPRDAATSVRVQASPWDPARGGFGGALVATTVAPGARSATRRARVSLDAPPLQFSGAGVPRLGQEFSNVVMSAGGSGPLVPDALFHNFGAQLTRRWSPSPSLLDLDPDALARSGIAADSARRLLDLLRSSGIPAAGARVPGNRMTTSVSFVERVDRYDWSEPRPGSLPHPSWWVTALGQLSRSDALGLSPTTAPGLGGRSTAGSAALQGSYKAYVGPSRTWLSETNSALTYSASRGEPYLTLPGATVLVTSQVADRTLGIGALRFGGNGALARDATAWSWEVTNQTAFVIGDHVDRPLKLFLQSRYDAYDETPSGNALGTFQYASLADLAANRPASFTRALGTPARRGGEWIGAAALGGDWDVSPEWGGLRITGGVRADGHVFTRAPAANPAIARAFGVRTDQAPNGLDLSPRLGFTWTRTSRPSAHTQGGPLASVHVGQSTMRGGVGMFRSLLPSTLLADALVSTGLPNGVRRLSCVGPATPIPDWSAFAADSSSVPSTCLGGAATFTDSAPAVQVFAPGFDAPRSWRGSLGWSGAVRRIFLSVDGTLAFNRRQPGTVDLNFAGQPRFTLADEGARPVFVAPASIVPGTGAVSPAESRRSAGFGRVAMRRSDLASQARQLTLWATPDRFVGKSFFSLGYTYADVRAQMRGFDGLTAGDPRTTEWARDAFTPRHQVQLQLGRVVKRVSLTTFIRAQSGLPFTPTVAGDVNGDGLAGDRAFVFDPGRVSDPALASGLHTLLRDAPASERDCLTRQTGRVAARSSCAGPWRATMNASLVGTRRLPNVDRTATLRLSLENVLGGVDQLLHGASLRGWGGPALPDQTLYRVQGFDPAARRFTYTVNPRFGASRPATSTLLAPFRISLDVALNLRAPHDVQALTRALRPPRGSRGRRAPAEVIAERYLRENFTDVYASILRRADSLALTSEQMAQLVRAQQRLRERADSVYGALGKALAALPENFDRVATLRRVYAANDGMWTLIERDRGSITRVLTERQIALLPPMLVTLLTTDRPVRFQGVW